MLSASQSLRGLTFQFKAYTFSSTGGAVLTLGSGGLTHNAQFDLAVNMDVVFGANQTWNSQSSTRTMTINGNVSGGFALSKTGSGNLVLTGASTYTGITTVTNAGILRFAKTAALYNGDTAQWTAANLTVNTGATVAFNVGGAGEFTTANVTTLLTNLRSVTNNGLRSGSNLGFDTTNAAGGTFTITDDLVNSTGTGGGAIGLNKFGSGTLVLAGTNTYTGRTSISAGTLVASSLANVSAASTFGTPTTTANGTIAIGSALTDNLTNITAYTNGTLLYTGGTTSTDRVINIAGDATLDSSGTGPITFTSAFTAITKSTTKTLTLTGTSTGNTISGAIPSSGSTALVKSGSGSWILSGANLYTGSTTISAGTLALGSSGTFATSPTINLGTTASPGTLDVTTKPSFTFGSGQTVAGVGTVNLGSGKTVTINGTLAPGNSTGIITITGDLVLGSSAVTNFEINGPTAGTGHDQINVSGTTTFGGAFNLTFGNTIANGSTLNLFGLGGGSTGAHFTSISGSGSGYTESWTNDGGSWTSTSIANSQLLTFNQSTGNLTFASAIPEPSTYAALFGVVALGFVAYRRRKRA